MPLFGGRPDVEQLKAKRDIRGLIKALSYRRDRDIRSAAAQALGVMKDAYAVEPLLATLSDEDIHVRVAAARAIGVIGDPLAVERLVIYLRYEDWRMRRVAAEALGLIGDTRAVEPLMGALKDNDRDMQWAAKEALAKMGEPAIALLVDALKDPGRDVRMTAIEILAKIRGTRVVEPLVAALRDEKWEVRHAAAVALKSLGWQPRDNTQRARQAIALKQWKEGVSLEEVVSLGAPAVEPLMEILSNSTSAVRKAAVEALGNIGDARAVQPLVEMLKDPGDIRATAAEALARIGKAAVDPLVEVLKVTSQADRFGQRSIAAKVLGDIRDVRAVEPLVEMLKDSLQGEAAAKALTALGWQPRDNTQRAWLAIALKQWEEVVSLGVLAVEPLVASLKDHWAGRRSDAAQALGKIGDRRAVEPLLEALKDESGEVQWAAAQALGKIGDKRAVEPLLEALKDESWLAAKTTFQGSPRSDVAKALTSLGWQPRDNTQRARQAIALRQWDEVISLGGFAVEPLMRAAREEKTVAEPMMRILQKVLERSATDMAPEDLWAVMGLTNLVQVRHRGGGHDNCGFWNPGADYEDEIDCSQVRQLARQELIRRGLQA